MTIERPNKDAPLEMPPSGERIEPMRLKRLQMKETTNGYAHGRPMDAPEDEWKDGEFGSTVGPTIASSDDGVRQKDIDAILNAVYGEENPSSLHKPSITKRNINDCNRILPWLKRLLKKLGIIACFLISISPCAVMASTWYVRNNGSQDTNDDTTRESAFAALGKAISSAQANDNTILGDGIYEIIQITKALRLLSENGYANTIIDCSQATEPFSWGGEYDLQSIGSYFKGCTFRNGRAFLLGRQ